MDLIVVNSPDNNFPDLVFDFRQKEYIRVNKIPAGPIDLNLPYCGVLPLLLKLERYKFIYPQQLKAIKFPFPLPDVHSL